MTQDFGKGFTVANLKNMRQFYLIFPIRYALRSELSWTHYRLLVRVENENDRCFYIDEAVKSQWSTRPLELLIGDIGMAKRGKSINLFLMDGEVDGRIKCTIANWTGIAYKIPRTELEKCKDRDELRQSGVYFLFGTSDQTGKSVVYIGQAGARKNGEGILKRLQEHKQNLGKDYWTEAIVFITANNSFGTTEISYLEHKFYNIALEANRYEVQNDNDPTQGNVIEEKESELEEFVDYAKIVVGALGHKVFVPFIAIQSQEEKHDDDTTETVFFLKRKSRKSHTVLEASCKRTKEGFVVLKGSHIEIIDSHSIPVTIKKVRQEANIDEQHILQEDMLFNSPSYAAAFVYWWLCKWSY